jgi:hypothetical protein
VTRGRGARLHAEAFGWDATAAAVLDVYAAARIDAGAFDLRLPRLAQVARVG